MYIKKTYPARELVHIVLVDKDILGWLAGTEKQVKKKNTYIQVILAISF